MTEIKAQSETDIKFWYFYIPLEEWPGVGVRVEEAGFVQGLEEDILASRERNLAGLDCEEVVVVGFTNSDDPPRCLIFRQFEWVKLP